MILLTSKVPAAEAEGYDVHGQDVKVLFGDVVVAYRVLERKVKLVIPLHHLVTVAFDGAGASVLDWAPRALPVNVDVHIILHGFGVFLAASLGGAMGHEPRRLQLGTVAHRTGKVLILPTKILNVPAFHSLVIGFQCTIRDVQNATTRRNSCEYQVVLLRFTFFKYAPQAATVLNIK